MEYAKNKTPKTESKSAGRISIHVSTVRKGDKIRRQHIFRTERPSPEEPRGRHRNGRHDERQKSVCRSANGEPSTAGHGMPTRLPKMRAATDLQLPVVRPDPHRGNSAPEPPRRHAPSPPSPVPQEKNRSRASRPCGTAKARRRRTRHRCAAPPPPGCQATAGSGCNPA